jgi:hypothetical protein
LQELSSINKNIDGKLIPFFLWLYFRRDKTEQQKHKHRHRRSSSVSSQAPVDFSQVSVKFSMMTLGLCQPNMALMAVQ